MLETALDRLGDHLRKPVIEAILTSWISRSVERQARGREVEEKVMDLDVAIGVGLDGLAALADVKRKDRTDEALRYAVRARMRVYRSTGKIADLLAVAELTVPGSTWVLTDTPPAAFVMSSADVIPDAAILELVANLRDTRGNAVGAALIASDVDPLYAWRWGDETATPVIDTRAGWLDDVGNTGGFWSGDYEI